MKKLAIITTHPIQYYAPIFQLLAQRGIINIRVFYTSGEHKATLDTGFGKEISWDIPLLNGYDYEWVENTASDPGSHHPNGIINPQLISRINNYQPNAILFFGWNYNSHSKSIRHFSKTTPIYFRGDSTLLNNNNPLKEILRTIYLKQIYKHVDHAFYVGLHNKAYFKKHGLKDSQLSFAPHAIDNSRFKEDRSQEANALRSLISVTADDILILYAGKFDTVKNVKLLVDALIRLNQQNVHLLLVGNGVNEVELKEQANKSAVKSNVHFLNFVNQSYIPVVYQAADLYCLPSLSETWGLSVNEAMACNKAILASDKVGCAIDLIKENYNGAIFKSNDKNSLMDALKKLLALKSKLQEYGKNSGSIIQKWNFTKIAEAIENQLLNEKN